MLNYVVEPGLLAPYLPAGTELDPFQDQHYVSVVGFLYHDTRVWGVGIPGYRRFSEVNLRFYVRYRGPEGWRRGVAFIKEIVPKRVVAWIARAKYGENFIALPMRHVVVETANGHPHHQQVEFRWKRNKRWESLALHATGAPIIPAPQSEAAYITEHYWGYTAHNNETTTEYRVDHPQWRVWQATKTHFDCDVATLYGEQFVAALSGKPRSALLAEGSRVAVFGGQALHPRSERIKQCLKKFEGSIGPD